MRFERRNFQPVPTTKSTILHNICGNRGKTRHGYWVVYIKASNNCVTLTYFTVFNYFKLVMENSDTQHNLNQKKYHYFAIRYKIFFLNGYKHNFDKFFL